MNQQANETIDSLTSQDTEDQDFFEFADLNLTDEQLAQIKGGPGSGWCSQCAVIYSNHNETTVRDDTEEVEEDFFQFADLSLTDEQLAEIKGGPGWCTQCGIVYSNHNETTVNDDAEEAEEDFFQFADLSLTDEQLAEIKGGPGSGWCTQCGGIYSNHNETTVSDDTEEAEKDFFQFAELSFTDEQLADEIKGGPRGSNAVVSLGKLGRVE